MRTAIVAVVLLVASHAHAAYRISAWIPPWDSNALTSIQANGGAIDESNPVWYSWNADGSVKKNWNAENSTWRAAMTGSTLVPTIQNVVSGSFSASAVSAMLATEATREAHASAIFQLVTSNAFDGIDVDYERVPAASRANFTAFLTTLRAKLHGAGKTLSVTVYAKTADVTWNGAGAEDWSAIGALADSVKIMAYDYHYETSDAGAIAPLSWLDQVATYAEATIPRGKIIVGLPWYGYDWSSGTAAEASYASATQKALANGATISHDANGEATYTYANHVVFFQDATSYKAKVDLLKQKHSGIGGFAHWALGVEDPAVWGVIRGTSTTPPPPAPQPPSQPLPSSDFAISGPSGVTLTQGTATTVDFRIVPINNFTASTTMTVLTQANFAGSISTANLTLHVATTAATLPGSYTMTLRFTSGSLTHDVPFTIQVNRASKHRAGAK